MRFIIVLFFLFLAPQSLSAFSENKLNFEERLTDIAKSRCDTEQVEGVNYHLKVIGDGKVEVSFLGRKGGEVKGKFEYSKTEWEGRQRVLKDHQSVENSNRRKCIREEIRSLREAYIGSQSEYIITDSKILNEYDDHRDGIYVKLRGYDKKSALFELYNNCNDMVYLSLTNYVSLENTKGSYKMSSAPLAGRYSMFGSPTVMCEDGDLGELITTLNPSQKMSFYVRPKEQVLIEFDDYSIINIPVCYKVGDSVKGKNWSIQLSDHN